MEKSTYKIKNQGIKGGWLTYLLMVAVACCFINIYIAIAVVVVQFALTMKYKKDPENQSALYYNYAIKCVAGGDGNKAKKALEHAIALNKYNKEAYFFLGCLYFDEADYTNALEYLKKGGVDEVQDASLTFVLGRCYYHKENFDTAIKYLEMIEYPEGTPMEKERLFTLGKAYADNEDYEEAYEILKKADMNMDELKGDSLEYCYYLGISAYHTDRNKEADNLIKDVYKVDNAYKFIDIYAKNIGIAI